ncbi:MAG: hypothetical protein IJV80_06755 [Clostridia bacterium]|nr:hypothetical protein [Clostridia bacterium]
MFGYVNLDKNAPAHLKNNFRKHYCFLCRALGYHYGQFSRFLVSFDVTFFLMLLAEDGFLAPVKKISCWNKTEELQAAVKTDFAKKVAAFNLTLVAGVLSDHIRDNDKAYAKPLYGALKGVFKRIEREYPSMWNTVLDGYEEMSNTENAGGSVCDIQDCFARLVEKVAGETFGVKDEGVLSHLIFVSKQLYFLDAVDDLDKDVSSGAYNPLKGFSSKKSLANSDYLALSDMVRSAKQHLKPLPSQGLNYATVSRIANLGMSEKLFTILQGELHQ